MTLRVACDMKSDLAVPGIGPRYSAEFDAAEEVMDDRTCERLNEEQRDLADAAYALWEKAVLDIIKTENLDAEVVGPFDFEDRPAGMSDEEWDAQCEATINLYQRGHDAIAVREVDGRWVAEAR